MLILQVLLLLIYQALGITTAIVIDSKHLRGTIFIAIKLVEVVIIHTIIILKRRYRSQFYKAKRILLIFRQCCKVGQSHKRFYLIVSHRINRHRTGSHHHSMVVIKFLTRRLEIRMCLMTR